MSKSNAIVGIVKFDFIIIIAARKRLVRIDADSSNMV